MAGFFGKTQPHTREHLYLHAAKTREEIKLETGIPIPEEKKKPKQHAGSDAWDKFWDEVRQGASFVVTESFAQTVKASASKRGIILRSASVGPFKVRVWRV